MCISAAQRRKTMKIDILTLFPEIFPGPLGSSVIGRAVKNGIVEINAIDLRNYAHDKHASVDDKPYGGGPGMLMRADVLFEALSDLKKDGTVVVLTSPRGEQFSQTAAAKMAAIEHLLILQHFKQFISIIILNHNMKKRFSEELQKLQL